MRNCWLESQHWKGEVVATEKINRTRLSPNYTLDFADQLDQHTIEDDETLVSYDVESLFSTIPLDETIDHTLDLIYKEAQTPYHQLKATVRL